MRWLAVLPAALIIALVTAAPASADLLGKQNARALAESLKDASKEQGICYGWDVTLEDNWRSLTTSHEVGSNLGVGVDPRTSRQCQRWVVLVINITWTSSSSESPDSASMRIEAEAPDAPTVQDLRRIGVTEESLLGEHDVRTVFNAIAALPQLVAEKSNQVGPPNRTPRNSPLPDSAHIAGSPGSDFFRANTALLLSTVVVGGLGVVWMLYALLAKRSS